MIYFFQKLGVKIRRMVNNSRRPTSIMKERIHFAVSEINEKLPEIPVVSVPNPVLETADSAQKKPSRRGIPRRHNTIPPTIITIAYIKRKAKVLFTIAGVVPF